MSNASSPAGPSVEQSVYDRYATAAAAVEPALCCPVNYNPDLLKAIPDEILDRDYGCGDPSPFVKEGDTVLDLGSGGGKLCYIAAQLVGEHGRVIGVDCNTEMLALAKRHQKTMADRLGFGNVEFRYGMIQNLKLDLGLLNQTLADKPIRNAADWLDLRQIEDDLERDKPMIEDNSVDCVVSNCVLNLVRQQDRNQLFAEVFRVLKPGGCAAISDIVGDEDVPEHLQQDGTLWSGCLSGAFREDRFLKAFEEAGFHGIELVKRESEPWQTVEGIEFRSVTVLAYKGKQGPCLERNQAVIYRGPFKQVDDDDGHTYYRGERMAVCDKTFQLLQKAPYAGLFDSVEPIEATPLEAAGTFNCSVSARRNARETKGKEYKMTISESDACCDDSVGGDGATCC